MSGDALRFLRAFLRDPSRVGAIAPSGKALASLITSDLTPSDLPILELGPGTGAFTQALVARGVPEDRLALIEADATLAAALARRFPRAQVLMMDAAGLAHVGDLFEEPVGAVVSGLPLLSLPRPDVTRILRGVFGHLRPGGTMYQFTYLPRCPVPAAVLADLGLTAVRMGSVWANLPPAFVYRMRLAKTASAGDRNEPPGV